MSTCRNIGNLATTLPNLLGREAIILREQDSSESLALFRRSRSLRRAAWHISLKKEKNYSGYGFYVYSLALIAILTKLMPSVAHRAGGVYGSIST
ncbi:hypothetical protein GY45DRAFT_25455 [Cubamyces sp. BRFM 1775]|nr:hypothetical protein GY45DRAFT_25455 [Cubamyces sp. BRFM 1775]